MKLLNYNGKLNNHKDYLLALQLLEKRCDYIELVLMADKCSTKIVSKFKSDIIECKNVTKWWSGKYYEEHPLYKIKASKELFCYLRKFKTFCYYFRADVYNLSYDKTKYTKFGIDDIAFYESANKTPLLCTTTHECYIMIREDLIVN